MSAVDYYFEVMATLALPAAIMYPVIYGFKARWWRGWIGFALLFKATGLALLLTMTVLFQTLGPEYWGRDFLRVSGITFITIGLWLALIAMLHEFHKKSSTRDTR